MKKCSVCGMNSNQKRIILYKRQTPLCWRHYLQVRRHGKPLKRTKYDENEIKIEGDICLMHLYNENGEYVTNTIFNKKHLTKVKRYKWGLQNKKYAISADRGLLLHHLIIGKYPDKDIDHINRDTLNNLDKNLRIVTHQQNCWNKKVNGVHFDKERNRWIARLDINKKRVLYKRFVSKQEAINKRKEAEKKYFKEFAPV